MYYGLPVQPVWLNQVIRVSDKTMTPQLAKHIIYSHISDPLATIHIQYLNVLALLTKDPTQTDDNTYALVHMR